jgi:hypothetical protein
LRGIFFLGQEVKGKKEVKRDLARRSKEKRRAKEI